jgi:hypothetical protein
MSTRNALTPRDPDCPVRASTTQRVARWARRRSQRPQIAAGIGLGKPLAPELVAAKQPGKNLFDHLGAAELRDSRPQDFVHRPGRGVHQSAAGELLAEYGAKDRRVPEAAEALRPPPPHPAVVEEQPLDPALVIKLGVDAVVAQRGY